MKKGEARVEYRCPAGSYSYEGPARFALLKLWWSIFKHRFEHWWRGDGWVD